MNIFDLPKRGADDYGSGEFLAPRNNHKHKGIDYACYPSTKIGTPVEGEVTKLGYCYSDDLSFRYVEVTDANKNRHRVMYIEPSVKEGNYISKGWIIGTSQNISAKWQKGKKIMKNHVHYEVLKQDGTPINPETYEV